MYTPSNRPSASSRGTYREGAPQRLQSAGLFALSSRKAKPVSVPVIRPILSSFICLAVEPEDAKLTGATRSLSRRLLALNMHHDS